MQFKDKQIEGEHSTQQRLFAKEESALQDQINDLDLQIKTEQLVTKKIRDFVGAKTEYYH